MKSAALLPHSRLNSAMRPVAVALLILLLPAAALANRPRVRPHHHVPPNWRKIVAAHRLTVAATSYSGSSSVSDGASFNFQISGASINSVASVSTNTQVSGGTLALANHLAGDLVKTGVGTLTLASSTAYSGNTTINAGTLSLTHASLANTAAVSLATGATLNLNFTGTDTVNQLRIDGIVQSPGTWGSLTSDATYRTALITGTGILNVVGDGSTNAATVNGGTLTLAGGTATTTVGSQTLNLNNAFVTNGGGTLTVTGTDPATGIIDNVTNTTLITNPVTTGAVLVINGGTIANPTLVSNQVFTDPTGSGLIIDAGVLSASALLAPAEIAAPSAAETGGGPAPVPEPSSVLLALLGAGILAQRRGR